MAGEVKYILKFLNETAKGQKIAEYQFFQRKEAINVSMSGRMKLRTGAVESGLTLLSK